MSMVGLLGLVLMAASSASASTFSEPGITGTWGDFANCPAATLVAFGVRFGQCEHSYTTGGVVQIGHSSAPISIPGDTLDVGVSTPGGGRGVVISGRHGILNGPAQPVPGGLLGAVGNIPLTGVTAKFEWATSVPPDTVFGFSEGCGPNPLVTFDICKLTQAVNGTAVTLSVRIHLISPFLGSSCFIGSAAHPIVIPLTTGVTSPPPPTKPIHGSSQEAITFIGEWFSQVTGVTLVSNSFSVPAAAGCGTSGGGLVDASINHKLGLPSPAGQNMITISAIGEQGLPSEVIAHGWTGE